MDHQHFLQMKERCPYFLDDWNKTCRLDILIGLLEIDIVSCESEGEIEGCKYDNIEELLENEQSINPNTK